MALTKLEHFLVLTDDIDKTRDFYRDILGCKEGFRADLGFSGYWLYIDDTPAIHIADWISYTAHSKQYGIPVTSKSKSTGAFDHIAFNGKDAQSMIDCLETNNIPYHRNDVPLVGLVQLFISDPNDVKIELNYMDD